MRHQSVHASLGACSVIASLLVVGSGRLEASPTTPAEFLYQVAQEHLKAGQEAEAIHELHKLLLIAPHDLQAQQQLARLESAQRARRDRVIEDTLTRLASRPSQASCQCVGSKAASPSALRHVERATAESVPSATWDGADSEAAIRNALSDTPRLPEHSRRLRPASPITF